MKLPITPADVPSTAANIEELLARIASGHALLFVGSGFSAGAINLHGEPMLRAKELAHRLAEIGKFPADDDLRYVSERVIAEGHVEKLIEFLRHAFAAKDLLPHHIETLKPSWLRVYTTNYDLVAERAAEQNGRLLETIDLNDPPSLHLKKGNLCVHLNGSLKSLSKESLGAGFKLSNSSYVSAESFLTSKWRYAFTRDLERSSAIVFVGYSLYDIEVQRILHENQEFRDKTYFIVREDIDEKSRFTLSRYGHVLTIGAEEFGKLVSTKLPKPPEQPETVFTVALARHQPKTNEHEIRDALIERFLVHGALSDELLDQAIAGHQPVPYLVQRENLERARDFVLEGRHLAVISEFGNGKSIFVRSLASLLALNHIDVYELVDAEDDYLADLRSLAEAGGRCVVVLDDYDRCVEAIEYMTTFSPPGLTLVVASRTSNHERLKPRLEHFGFGYVEFAIDTLSEAEAEGVVDIFDNVGFWGDLAALPRERKRSKILNECRGHISSVLLDIFETSQMRQRVSKLLEPLLTNAEYKSTLFAISLLQTLGIPPTGSLISRIALNDSILESSLRTNDSFVELCNFRGGVVRSRSSLFGTSLIRNNFSAGYIVDRILAFLGSFGDGRGDAPNIQQIVKELMRFKNIEALLPERNRRDNLLRFYELLKREVPWQAYEPHYWVQYAMALLTFSEFDRAQQLLDTAYSLAEKRIGYHTVNIDTQQARLHLLRCLSSTSGPEALRSFNAGHRVLMGVPDDMGKWRQIDRYEEIYRLKYPLFSNGGKVEFEHACKAVLASISNAISKGGLTPRAEYLTNVIKKELGSILDGIRQSRS